MVPITIPYKSRWAHFNAKLHFSVQTLQLSESSTILEMKVPYWMLNWYCSFKTHPYSQSIAINVLFNFRHWRALQTLQRPVMRKNRPLHQQLQLLRNLQMPVPPHLKRLLSTLYSGYGTHHLTYSKKTLGLKVQIGVGRHFLSPPVPSLSVCLSVWLHKPSH